MSNAPVSVTVGNKNYYITKLDPFTALEVFGDLQKELLPAVGELVLSAVKDGIDGKKASLPTGDGDISQAITKLSTALSGAQLKYWTNRLLTPDHVSVELSGKTVRLEGMAKEMAFDDFSEILELLVNVITINFAAPILGFLNRFGTGQQSKAAASK